MTNNHTLDYGGRALMNTIKYAKSEGFDCVGAGNNIVNAQALLVKRIKNKNVAFINCCEHEFSIATKDSPGTNPLDPISQYYTIKSIKNKVDCIIVIVHGGHEGFQLPSPRMQDTYRFLIDAGANIVVNHYQHCFSGIERYNSGMIFYGLGNFIFPDDNPMVSRIWNEGYLLEINLNKGEIDYCLYPYLQCLSNLKVKLMDEMEQERFNMKIKSLNGIISDRAALETENTNWRKETQKAYKSSLSPYSNKYLRGYG